MYWHNALWAGVHLLYGFNVSLYDAINVDELWHFVMNLNNLPEATKLSIAEDLAQPEDQFRTELNKWIKARPIP